MSFKKPILFLLLSLSFVHIWAEDSLDRKVRKVIAKEFGDSISIKLSSYNLSNEEIKRVENASRISIHDKKVDLIKIFKKVDLVANGIIRTVDSKTGSLTVLTIIEKNQKIRAVKIINAQDPRSFNLNSKLWLRQFIGKTDKSVLRVGKDIDAMSGATISSNAATKAVKISLFILRD